MNFIRKVFHCSENKFFAVLFSGLALGVTIAWVVYALLTMGTAFLTFNNIWNYFVLFLIYGTLFVYNVRNDNRAYIAISLLLFVSIIGSFFNIVYDFIFLIQSRFSLESLVEIPGVLMDIGVMVLGAFTYIYLNAYRIGRMSDYKKVRLFLILFAISVILPSLASFITFAAAGRLDAAWLTLLVGVVAEFANLCAAVAAIFTFNRLIR